jgi:ribosomal protein S18 acetylase RimI-like enzyme
VAEPGAIRIVEVVDRAAFDLLPPCADARFDHRSCDYWEDDVRGSKAARPSWWQEAAPRRDPPPARPDPFDNPFAAPAADVDFNPFVPTVGSVRFDPFGDADDEPVDNPFAPRRKAPDRDVVGTPRKLALLSRGLGVSGSYAKVLELDGAPAVFAQFGPLSAYPRARQVRDLYPRLPRSPLPAVITCISTAPFARRRRLAQALVSDICDDLGRRGFSAVEAYPDLTLTEASAARPGFWVACGFFVAAEDERFPVMRIELA